MAVRHRELCDRLNFVPFRGNGSLNLICVTKRVEWIPRRTCRKPTTFPTQFHDRRIRSPQFLINRSCDCHPNRHSNPIQPLTSDPFRFRRQSRAMHRKLDVGSPRNQIVRPHKGHSTPVKANRRWRISICLQRESLTTPSPPPKSQPSLPLHNRAAPHNRGCFDRRGRPRTCSTP